jgi:hypothetical protein
LPSELSRPPRVHGTPTGFRPQPRWVEVHLADRCELYITPVADHVINIAVLAGKEVTKAILGVIAGATPLKDCGWTNLRKLLPRI